MSIIFGYAGSDCFGRRNLPNQAENSSKSMENSPELISSGGSSFTGFEQGNSKSTCRRRVLELGTRGRQLEQSDRVNAGRVRADWAGGLDSPTSGLDFLKFLKPSTSL